MTPVRNSPLPDCSICSLTIVILGVLFASTALAQTKHAKVENATSWKLTAVRVTGSQRYKTPEIVAATELLIGQTTTNEDFQRATSKLGKTGAFDSVSYNFTYSGDTVQLQIQVVDASQYVPVRFENFVWFSDQELRSTLHEQVPLFDGLLPVSGGLVEQVSDALQVMLLQRKIPAHADYLRAGPEGGPINAFVFSVTGPYIRVRDVGFEGAGSDELPALKRLGKELVGTQYSRTALLVQTDKNLLPVLLAHGYLKAAFAEARAKVVNESHEDNQDLTEVEVTFQVEPGRQYKVDEIHWSGNKAIPVEKLQPLLHLVAGQPANAVRLKADLEDVGKLYGTLGYVTAKVQAMPKFDETRTTVSYQLDVHEGDVYHMGDVDIQGLDDRDARQVLAKWGLARGAVYDASYANQFLAESFKSALLDPKWNVKINEDPDSNGKTVDVTLHFSRKTS